MFRNMNRVQVVCPKGHIRIAKYKQDINPGKVGKKAIRRPRYHCLTCGCQFGDHFGGG